MATAVESSMQTVRVQETPHVLRVEIDLPEGEPQLHVSVTGRVLEVRVFRPYERAAPWHASPDATPT
jgi:hypothetical protein